MTDYYRERKVFPCLFADCSVEAMQAARAGLIFIVCSEEGKGQINNFKDKVEVISRRCPHRSSIEVVTKEDFERGKGFKVRSTRKKTRSSLSG